MSENFSRDVAVIGCGRVGLPLALAFADRGLRVVGVDKDPARLATDGGQMPFDEPGAPDVLERVLAAGRFEMSARVDDAAQARHIVITLGTPTFSHIEIDLSDIRSVLDDLLGVLRPEGSKRPVFRKLLQLGPRGPGTPLLSAPGVLP